MIVFLYIYLAFFHVFSYFSDASERKNRSCMPASPVRFGKGVFKCSKIIMNEKEFSILIYTTCKCLHSATHKCAKGFTAVSK